MIIRGANGCYRCDGAGIAPLDDPPRAYFEVKSAGTTIGYLCDCAHVEVGTVVKPTHGCDADACEHLAVAHFRADPNGAYVYACHAHFSRLWAEAHAQVPDAVR